MDPVVTDPLAREARMLAAIVFTDVVGFSKLATQNEARVYGALQRDMATMTSLCRAHGGQVLNTMGDGMLLCFTSAVDALACATEIQRTLFNQAQSLPTIEVLHHRIGVHLGDVIMSGDNVFGDGVNVAARLQALAKPDAVCFSHTVYEVVKNKLKVDARYLGPRQLKNLGEPVRVWQVPPLDEHRTNGEGMLDADPEITAAEIPHGAAGWKGGALVFVSLLLIGIVVVGFMKMKAPPKVSLGSGLNGKPSLIARIRRASEPKDEAPADAPTKPAPGPAELSIDDATTQLQALRKSYRFQEIVTLLAKLPMASRNLVGSSDTYEKLAAMEEFVAQQIAMAKNTSAIQLARFDEEGGVSESQVKVYGRGDRLVVWTPTSGEKEGTFADLSPLQFLEIATAAEAAPIDGSPVPSSAATGLQLFSKEYNVTVPQ